MEKKETSLTLRSILVGIVGLAFITASSMYVALKAGALPWPTVFVTVLSMTILRKAKGSTLQEINCTHTLMSAGSMVAGGLAFTVPGLWMLSSSNDISLMAVMAASVTGSLLGTLFTALYRPSLIEEKKLPYPIGEASYRTLMTEKDEKSSPWLFSSLAASGVFAFVRDFFGRIPSLLTVFGGNTIVPGLQIYVSPMALSIGAIIGPALAAAWVIGMVAGYFILTPVGIETGLFSSMAEADSFRSSLGLGIMIGTGFAVAVKAVFQALRNRKTRKSERNTKALFTALVIVVLSVAVLTLFTEMTLVESILTVAGAAVTTYLSSMLTGQTGINPMEVFAILVLLAVHALCKTGTTAAFTVAAAVAVACGLSGDVMNDFKSGSLIGTDPKDQVKAEAIGGVIGAVIATLVLFLMKNVFVFGSADMPAPQAKAVASLSGGLDNAPAFWIGVAVGAVLFLLNLPSSAVGLGMYLGTYITVTVGLGALISWMVNKFSKKNVEKEASLVSAGLLGGEGCAGVIIAFITLFKG